MIVTSTDQFDVVHYTKEELRAIYPKKYWRRINALWYIAHGEGKCIRIKDTELGREVAERLRIEVGVVYPNGEL